MTRCGFGLPAATGLVVFDGVLDLGRACRRPWHPTSASETEAPSLTRISPAPLKAR